MALRGGQMRARPGIETACTATTSGLVSVTTGRTTQITALQGQVETRLGRHLRR